MNWTIAPYDEPPGFAWVLQTPIGEFVVDAAPWVDARQPWIVDWWPVGCGSYVTLGHRASARTAKALAERYIRKLAERLNEAVL